jgi:uncharacterized damage-inducible protein DinB
MRTRTFQFFVVAAALVGPLAPLLHAQTSPVVVDLVGDVRDVQQKMIDLAKVIPAAKMTWRPAPGVRSVQEVLLHVASDNYLLPSLHGTAMPTATKLSARDFKTFETYEKRALTPAQTIAELETSFTHLTAAMTKTTAAQLATPLDMFGQKSNVQKLWIGTTTHLHEHLGQLIAYARSNGVTPPWSK